jgi:hypothetical protein
LRHAGLRPGGAEIGPGRIGRRFDLVILRGRHRAGRHKTAIARLIAGGFARARLGRIHRALLRLSL